MRLLHTATNGPYWNSNTNWCTTVDHCSWEGVECVSGRVAVISLQSNNLEGTLPTELGQLPSTQPQP